MVYEFIVLTNNGSIKGTWIFNKRNDNYNDILDWLVEKYNGQYIIRINKYLSRKDYTKDVIYKCPYNTVYYITNGDLYYKWK